MQGATGETGAAGTNAGVGGFTHYLGEAFNGGIIYYLYKGSDGLEHGLIVALNSSGGEWQTTPTLVNANRTDDGVFNTTLMTNSPAKTYITSLGAGWYLPSTDELNLLYSNRFIVQKALRTGGNALLGAAHWSSTETSSSSAYYFQFNDGSAYSAGKTAFYQVRAIRAF
jgi:hypothetical protein